MPGLLFAHALVPAFCEEAIRSSYLFYLGDRGSRRNVVFSLGAVFVVGEILYDASLYPLAKAEIGGALSASLLAFAILSGTCLHIALTFWTAYRQKLGQNAWIVFALALAAHATFNLIALIALGAIL